MREKRASAAGREEGSSRQSLATKGRVSPGTGARKTGIDEKYMASSVRVGGMYDADIFEGMHMQAWDMSQLLTGCRSSGGSIWQHQEDTG